MPLYATAQSLVSQKILAKHLDRYAEIGDAYVKKLETLIRVNDFSRFALASLN